MKKLLFFTLFVFLVSWMMIMPDKIRAQNFYSIEEISKHQTPEDCWMTIEGKVYDLSNYLPNHDRWLDLRDWCGRDATQDYNDKAGMNRAHSPRADEMLAEYLIGDLGISGEDIVLEVEQMPIIEVEESEVNLFQSDVVADSLSSPESNFAPKYRVWLPVILTIAFYFLSKKFLKKSSHDFIWNSIMLIGLIPVVGFGFFLALADQVPFLAKIDFNQMLRQHAQLSIIIGTAMILHFIQRAKIFRFQGKSAFRKKKKEF